MGNCPACLRICYKHKEEEDEGLNFSEIYPSLTATRRITFIHLNDHEFMAIPDEKQLDRTINYYRSAFALNRQDIANIEEALSSLQTFKDRIERDSVNLEAKILKTSLELDSDRDHLISNKRTPRLILEIQKGNIIWTDILTELSSPYLKIKIIEEADGKQNVLREFATNPASHSAIPTWNQVFNQEFEAYSSNFKTMHFKIMLFFIRKKSNTPVQIGSDQTFSFSELMDQSVRLKEVFFKHQNSVGNIVKIAFRVQFIHDFANLSKNLLSAVNFRMSELQKLTKKSGSLIGSKSELDTKSRKNSSYFIDKSESVILEGNYNIL